MPRSFIALGAALRQSGAVNTDTPLIPVEEVREHFRPITAAPLAARGADWPTSSVTPVGRSLSADSVPGGPTTPSQWNYHHPAVLTEPPRLESDAPEEMRETLAVRRGWSAEI